MKSSKAVAQTALLTALAVLSGYIESLVPAFIPVAGVKLGLGNIAVVSSLYLLGEKRAWTVCVLKIFLCALLYGGFSPFLYSLCGGILSMAVQCIAKRTSLFSVSGVSALGAIFHNIGQIVCASFIIGKAAIYYLPVLVFTGGIGGFITGILARLIIKRGGELLGQRRLPPSFGENTKEYRRKA